MLTTAEYADQFKAVDGLTVEGCTALVNHPNFHHTRAGTGCWREVAWIYHRCEDSPSGFILVGSTSEAILRQCHIPAYALPLSPTERA